MIGLLLLLLLNSALVFGDDSPGAWTLERLMESLAAVPSVNARFREEKRLAVLQEPLVTTGILRYRSPDYVEKHTLHPYEERFEIKDDWLVMEHPAEGKRNLSLAGHPGIQAFVESFRATLAGDLRGLRRYYRVRLQGEPGDWTLRLEPIAERMAEFITAIVVRGRDIRVVAIETLEADGDSSVIAIEMDSPSE